ncbi:MAG: phosphonate C-P lyase system protein PhnG [Puia sp.]|nr:phosphonate C-P lyase system protein PhnG [Puia sp.]
MTDKDYILCECELSPLEQFIASLEKDFEIKMAGGPAVCLTMIKAEDSVEGQPFYLGEALTTECEVLVNGIPGLGLCMGDEPVRSYCIAFLDALEQLDGPHTGRVDAFLQDQARLISEARTLEYNHILRTRVDFKLMEQE